METRPRVFSNSIDDKSKFRCVFGNLSVRAASQSQCRLVLCVTGSGGGGLAFLVEFQEAGFLYHHGHSRFVAVGLFQLGQGAFLRSFG